MWLREFKLKQLYGKRLRKNTKYQLKELTLFHNVTKSALDILMDTTEDS